MPNLVTRFVAETRVDESDVLQQEESPKVRIEVKKVGWLR